MNYAWLTKFRVGFIVLMFFVLALSIFNQSRRNLDSPTLLNEDQSIIDPLCFYRLLGQNPDGRSEEGVDVRTCADPGGLNPLVAVPDVKDQMKGYVFNSVGQPDSADKNKPYFYYRWLGRAPTGDSVIWVDSSSDGMTRLSRLFTVRHIHDHLIYGQTLVQGDRCQAGILSAELKGRELRYQTHVTPFDYFQLAANLGVISSARLALYTPLVSNCPACCAGTFDWVNGQVDRLDLTNSMQHTQTLSGDVCLQNYINDIQRHNLGGVGKAEIVPFLTGLVQKCDTIGHN